MYINYTEITDIFSPADKKHCSYQRPNRSFREEVPSKCTSTNARMRMFYTASYFFASFWSLRVYTHYIHTHTSFSTITAALHAYMRTRVSFVHSWARWQTARIRAVAKLVRFNRLMLLLQPERDRARGSEQNEANSKYCIPCWPFSPFQELQELHGEHCVECMYILHTKICVIVCCSRSASVVSERRGMMRKPLNTYRMCF